MTGASRPAHDAHAGQNLPIIPHCHPKLTRADFTKLAELAARIAAQEPNLAKVPAIGHLLGSGLHSAPSLLLEDHGGIQLAHAPGSRPIFRYRALLLAADGDVVAVRGPRNKVFEAYCREILRLGMVDVVSPASGDANWPTAIACAKDLAFVERLTALARASGSLNVVPYMAKGGLWWLASELASHANVPVRVAAPPPNLAHQVNDKTWFARRAVEVLGKAAVPESIAVYGMAGLVGHIWRLAKHNASVAVKLTHSAASRGNLVLDATDMSDLSPAALRERLSSRMRESG